jgi:hypothetical protein
MKIAVCISGQPRSFEKGYEYLNKNILDAYNTDIFYHTWNYHDDMKKSIEKLYKPVLCSYDDQFDMDFINRNYPSINEKYPACNAVSMFFSVFMVNSIFRKYCLTHGEKYDIVVKTRFDFAINKIIKFEDVDANKVYVPNCRMTEQRNFCNDQFAYGTPKVMNLYSATFMNIDRLVDLGFPCNGEDLLSGNLQINNLIGDNLVYVDMNHTFKANRYDSMNNSLIRDDFSLWNKLR